METLVVRFTKDPYDIERHGAWIDLQAAEDYDYKSGDDFKVDLGVNIKVPDEYEGLLLARSSTYDKYHVIQTNAMGVIESDYCGNDDVWKLPVHAVKDGHISKGDRVCQFRLLWSMQEIQFKIVDDMPYKNRGGFGSTGV